MKKNELDYYLACQVSDFLLKSGKTFMFVDGYGTITKNQCEEVIDNFNTLKD